LICRSGALAANGQPNPGKDIAMPTSLTKDQRNLLTRHGAFGSAASSVITRASPATTREVRA
jgi:hypothetical protein